MLAALFTVFRLTKTDDFLGKVWYPSLSLPQFTEGSQVHKMYPSLSSSILRGQRPFYKLCFDYVRVIIECISYGKTGIVKILRVVHSNCIRVPLVSTRPVFERSYNVCICIEYIFNFELNYRTCWIRRWKACLNGSILGSWQLLVSLRCNATRAEPSKLT